ncbi:hypothetical protein LB503_010440 [Fusarium chuoi]|nr:hypothetical protein LB503_010440 [Fusarium chuoi]
MVLHDWPDEYAANILRHLVPQLDCGSSEHNRTSFCNAEPYSQYCRHAYVVPQLLGAQLAGLDQSARKGR